MTGSPVVKPRENWTTTARFQLSSLFADLPQCRLAPNRLIAQKRGFNSEPDIDQPIANAPSSHIPFSRSCTQCGRVTLFGKIRMNDSHVFLGLRSSVVCVDTKSGETVWSKELGSGFGEGFVSMALADKVIFAHTRGKLYCLDRETGSLQWVNQLEGKGFGTAFICCDSSPTSSASLLKKESTRSSGS